MSLSGDGPMVNFVEYIRLCTFLEGSGVGNHVILVRGSTLIGVPLFGFESYIKWEKHLLIMKPSLPMKVPHTYIIHNDDTYVNKKNNNKVDLMMLPSIIRARK